MMHLSNRGFTHRGKAYTRFMEHLSDWHNFDPKVAKTYPKVDAPLQLRFADGSEMDGNLAELARRKKNPGDSQITGWRYIKGPTF
jgi:hypothetical protein